jgi:hypothetical protein
MAYVFERGQCPVCVPLRFWLDDAEDAASLWQEEQASPEMEILRQRDAETIRRLVAERS